VATLLGGVLIGGVTMAAGMLIHEASVLVVILNAMRLLKPRPRTAPRARGSGHANSDVPVGLVALR